MNTEGVRAEPVSMLSRSGTLHLIGRASGTGRFQTECGTGWAFTRGQDSIRQRRACKLCFPPVPDFSSSTLTDLQTLTDERTQARDIAVRLEQENAQLRAAANQEPGMHVQIWMPDAPEDEADALLEAIADLAMNWEPRGNWDAHIVANFPRPAAPVDGAE